MTLRTNPRVDGIDYHMNVRACDNAVRVSIHQRASAFPNLWYIGLDLNDGAGHWQHVKGSTLTARSESEAESKALALYKKAPEHPKVVEFMEARRDDR